MKYKDVASREWDDNECILYDAEGNVVDRIFGNEMVDNWLDDNAEKQVYGSDPSA